VPGADLLEAERVRLLEDLRALAGVVPGVLDDGPGAEVVAGDLEPVGVGELAHLCRRPPVIVTADLELGVTRVRQHLERAGHVEFVVGEQVADGEELDPDPVQRDVTALAEAVVLAAIAFAARTGDT
jgi:hypothetical protein